MKKLVFTILCLMVFPIITSSVAYAEPIYFTHVEIGYNAPTQPEKDFCIGLTNPTNLGKTQLSKDYCLSNPEYSNPANNDRLNAIEDDMISIYVEENDLAEAANILRNNNKKAIFLVFPYYAEKHANILKQLITQGFDVGIHIHEDWKELAKATPAKIDEYLRSEKARLEKAIGRNVTFFSYGTGIELTGKDGTKLNSTEIMKIFKGIGDAGFKKVQTIDIYSSYAKGVGLIPIYQCGVGHSYMYETCLIGLPHSFELHTRFGTDKDGMDRLRHIVEYCHEEYGASSQCNERKIGGWCYSDIKKNCNINCQYSEFNCKNYGSNYYCSNGACVYSGGGGCPILYSWNGNEFVKIKKLNIHAPEGVDALDTTSFKMKSIDEKYEVILREADYISLDSFMENPDGSHINYVKLIDETGKECKLISAVHSKYGDVLQALQYEDENRIRTLSGEEIKLTFESCSGESFTLTIEGYNRIAKMEISSIPLLAIFIINNIFSVFAVNKTMIKLKIKKLEKMFFDFKKLGLISILLLTNLIVNVLILSNLMIIYLF